MKRRHTTMSKPSQKRRVKMKDGHAKIHLDLSLKQFKSLLSGKSIRLSASDLHGKKNYVYVSTLKHKKMKISQFFIENVIFLLIMFSSIFHPDISETL